MTRENLLSQQSSYKNLLATRLENNSLVEEATEFDYGIIWRVIPRSTPKIIRKCSRCERDRFNSSDKFRVNANKKLIDVWLIYKCGHCEATLNLPIIHRTAITKIAGDLLSRFQSNDVVLCWRYAFDASFFQKGMKLDWEIDVAIEEHILDNRIEFEQLSKTLIIIKSQYNLKIPIFSVLRSKMQISRAQIEKLQCNKALEIFNFNGEPLVAKTYLGSGCVLMVSNL